MADNTGMEQVVSSPPHPFLLNSRKWPNMISYVTRNIVHARPRIMWKWTTITMTCAPVWYKRGVPVPSLTVAESHTIAAAFMPLMTHSDNTNHPCNMVFPRAQCMGKRVHTPPNASHTNHYNTTRLRRLLRSSHPSCWLCSYRSYLWITALVLVASSVETPPVIFQTEVYVDPGGDDTRRWQDRTMAGHVVHVRTDRLKNRRINLTGRNRLVDRWMEGP